MDSGVEIKVYYLTVISGQWGLDKGILSECG